MGLLNQRLNSMEKDAAVFAASFFWENLQYTQKAQIVDLSIALDQWFEHPPDVDKR